MAEPQEAPQVPNQNLNPELAGFQTPEQLANAYRQLEGRYGSSSAEAKRLHDELEATRGQLLQSYQAQATPRQNVPQRNTPSDRLSEFGVPVDALDQYVNDKLQSAFAPIAAGMTARNTVLAQYPDYNKFEADVAQFIQSDPNLNQSYQRIFSTDPVAAFEYAFLKFGESRRRQVQPDGSESLMQEASSHAGIPMSRSGDARRINGNQNEVANAWEQWQKTGSPSDATRYAKTRLKTAISDEFLNQ